jgi:hypothetical protein
MFELKQVDPAQYRQQTRRSTIVLSLFFLSLAMSLATLAVMLFGQPGGDNFRWNLAGVLAGLALTAALVRTTFSKQAWMAPAVYGWQLKRSLMSITNVMHHVTAGVAAGDPDALKLLRFYHLGIAQMYELDGNSSDQSQLARESLEHLQRMQTLDIEPDQRQLDPAWIQAVKGFAAKTTIN